MRKIGCIFFLIVVMCIAALPTARTQEVKDGDITFQPNPIPSTNVIFNNSRFVFDWFGNHLEIGMYVEVQEVEYELEVEQDKTKSKLKIDNVEYEFEMESNVIIEKSESNITWGLDIPVVNSMLTNYTDAFTFKILKTNFPISEIETEITEVQEIIEPGKIQKEEPINITTIKTYNITRFILPDNLALSFEDLWEHEFIVYHPNEIETVVKNVTGKSRWNMDPITYGWPTITVTGFTVGTPCTFWDVWNASVSNGWGVVLSTLYSGQYQFALVVDLVIGNGSTTYFADTNVGVFFNTTWAGINDRIWIKSGANVSLGTLVDPITKRTTDGVNIIAGASISGGVFDVDPGGVLELYGCHITTLAPDEIDIQGNMTIYGTTLTNIGLAIVSGYSGTTDIYRTTIEGGLIGVNQPSGAISGDDFIIHSTTQAISVAGVNSPTFTDLVARNNTYLARSVFYSGDLYLVDADVDNWAFTYIPPVSPVYPGKVHRQYSFDLTFMFTNNTFAQGTNVTISNDYLGSSDSWILSANGSIQTQTYSMGHYNQTGGGTIYDYNPYNITATLDGYQTYTALINITRKNGLVITLQEVEAESVFSVVWFMAGSVGGTMIGLLLGVALVRLIKKREEEQVIGS